MKKNTQQTKLLWLMTLLTLTAFLPTFVQAQVATNYNFASSAGTYTPITGGTVLGIPAQDEDLWDGNALPFPFSFSGTTMTHFGVASNGYMVLAPSVATNLDNSYAVISDNFAINSNVIAPFSADLEGASTGELSYTTLGTTPNRTLVVQWKNYRPWLGTTIPYNFQVRLSETSNVITIVYGTFLGEPIDVEVGLMGVDNTDYNNRTTSTNWAATTAGTTNADVCSVSGSVFPVSGQTFTWTPASCIGVGGLSASAITTTTATLNWSSNASAVGGYNVQYRVVGAPTFTAFAGNPVIVGTSASITGLNSSSTYEFQVQSICAGVGNTSSFSPSSNFNTLCVPISSFPYFEGFEGITADGQLPNCMSRSSTTICLTYAASQTFGNRIPRTGNKFGAFRYGTAATGDYFYSAALQLSAGRTYRFSVWYTTDGNANWGTLDAYVGTNASPTGLVAIPGASVTGPSSLTYSELAGTFTVPSTGIYYVALRCATPSFSPDYLSFDDLSVDNPCTGVSFTPATLPSGDLTTPYNQTIAATGGVAPYTYSVTAGVIPAGLTFNTTTGVISGTPTSASISPPPFTIKVVDATGCNISKSYSITVTSVPCLAISITPTTVPTATLGALYPATAVQFMASGVTGATYAYSLISGSLPSGMSLNATTGRLTGTPNTVPASPTITVKARVTTGPSAGCFGTVTLDLVVNCPIITFAPTTLLSAVVNVPYSQQLKATDTSSPSASFNYTTTSTLPSGFALSPTGVLSGVSTDLVAPTSITIKATRSNGCNVSQTYMFGVVPAIEAPEQLDPIQISSSSFRARWKPVARAAKYRLYIATSPTFDGGTFAIGYVGLTVVGDTSISVQNLKPETKYYIQVTAISFADEVSPYSNVKTATTLSAVTSIDNALSSQVKVSPNPSNDKFSVDFGTLNLGKTTARVFDAQGKQVLSSEINANQTTISLGNMANGIYLLEISSNKGRILKRLVKE